MLLLILGSGEFPGYSVIGSLGAIQSTRESDPTSVALAMVRVMPILVDLAIQVIGIH